MANTYEAIQTTTLGSSAATVTLGSISGAYTDLVLVCTYTKSATNTAGIYVNGDDASAFYSQTTMFGTASTAYSIRESNGPVWYMLDGSAASISNPNIYIAQFQNYSNTTTFKTMIGKGGVGSNAAGADVCLWRNTDAITSITFSSRGIGTISAGSTFTLYGILAA
jgi:hypothetical protein